IKGNTVENSGDVGISTSETEDMIIDGNQVRVAVLSGIAAASATNSTVSNNIVRGVTGADSRGILFNGTPGTHVGNIAIGNRVTGCVWGMDIYVETRLEGNNLAGNSSGEFRTNNSEVGPFRTITSGDATPTVKDGTNFISAGATTITYFDDGHEGQTITFRAAGSITVAHDGSAIFLVGAANFAMASNDTLTLKRINGAWYEIGRKGAGVGSFTTLTATDNVSFDGGTFVFNETGADLDARFEGDNEVNLLFTDASADRVGIGTASPARRLHVLHTQDAETFLRVSNASTGTGAAAAFEAFNDDSKTMQLGVTSSANTFGGVYPQNGAYLTASGAGGLSIAAIAGPLKLHGFATSEIVLNDTGADVNFRVEGDTDTDLLTTDAVLEAVGIGIAMGSQAGKLHVVQASSTGAKPVLYLTQADVDQDMMELNCTIGTGNAIEAVGAKTLTTTHFVKVTITGVGDRYFPVGTIA
ncbi:MAG: right-handed parallel beta-helix repeat-containing protein, partial [Gemmatimonadaceae bacterium]|nr:right-handed parallel beta-helix repeat-containing protein [Gemmatimonadaceae bacterium]